MFKLNQSATFEWPVKWKMPGDGKMLDCTFTGVFKRCDTEQMKAVFEAADGTRRDDDAVARDVLVDWKHVQGEDGAPLAFSGPALDTLLRVVGARPAIVTAFIDAMSGGLDRKNS